MEIYFAYLVGAIAGVIAHETGHAICGWITGYPVHLIQIGYGRRLVSFRLHTIEIEFRINPFGGSVTPYLAVYDRPLRYFFFIMGGVLGNIVLIFATLPWWLSDHLKQSTEKVLIGFVLAQVLMIVGTLLPRRYVRDGINRTSDGFKIWELLRSPKRGLTEAGKFYLEQLAPYAAPTDPVNSLTSSSPRIIYLMGQRAMAGDADAQRLNNAQLNAELARGKLSVPEELHVLEMLVTDTVLLSPADKPALLDAWSARALALAPHLPTVRFSRAAALIELGRYAEGRTLLLSSLTPADSPFDTTLNSIFLAKAELALGNGDRAKDLLAKAEKHIEADIPEDRRDQLRDLLSRTRLVMAEPA